MNSSIKERTLTPPFEQPGKRLRPSFDDLPLREGDPKGSAWGLWGDEDEIGTLNLITPEAIARATQEACRGVVVPLSLPLEEPVLPMNPRRTPCSHRINAKGYANDDEIHLNTQSSSHWDGLRHYPYQIEQQRRFYNGVTQDDISGPESNPKIGIQNLARRGIVGRGVLLDWREYAKQKGIKYSPFETHAIPLQELLDVARSQNVSFCPGDVLLIRTGWTEEYRRLSGEAKLQLATREVRSFVGVEASEEMFRWHWDSQFAAVASDTNAYESWPPTKPWGVSCHEVLLSGWGMPIGEVWDLEKLSGTCRALGKWTFLITSSPLNLNGGVASPSNALAIF
ncbi:uncharacterized protein PV06_04041 [Exophiala oligosperma]|uniref:Cyclase n=2 Tax=Chaetothyriales TaxID=34395 RepID=A0A0D2ECG7_9EURO|nr:uncharacterized protein PV06_04041 [Exophiala oligosperma]KAJ9637476.1 hypothetical protein H2204_004900 [Knufia peltigerae]KIW45669.1 hypothetical protein PV06_04041 [Exophiala oligosperma]